MNSQRGNRYQPNFVVFSKWVSQCGKQEKSFSMKFGNECYGLASHEQYTFPYYKNYVPDHLLRIDTAARTAYEHGCKPVFFQQAFLGNDAWE